MADLLTQEELEELYGPTEEPESNASSGSDFLTASELDTFFDATGPAEDAAIQDAQTGPFVAPAERHSGGRVALNELLDNPVSRGVVALTDLLGAPIRAADDFITGREVELETPGLEAFESSLLPEEEIAEDQRGEQVIGQMAEEALLFAMGGVGLAQTAGRALIGKAFGRTFADNASPATIAQALQNRVAARNAKDVATSIGKAGDETFVSRISRAMSSGMPAISKGASRFFDNFLDSSIASAIQNPSGFFRSELGAMASGTVLASQFVAAEREGGEGALFNDPETAAVWGGIIGGVINPGPALVNLFRNKTGALNKIGREFTGKADQVRAGRILRDFIDRANAEPDAPIIKLDDMLDQIDTALARREGLGISRETTETLSPASLIDEGADATTEGTLRRQQEFLGTVQEEVSSRLPSKLSKIYEGSELGDVTDFQKSALDLANKLVATDDPNLIRLAAEYRKAAFDQALKNRMTMARGKITGALARLAPDDVTLADDPVRRGAQLDEIRRTEGANISSTLEEALADANKAETLLYSNIAGKREVTSDNLENFLPLLRLNRTVDEIASSLGEGSRPGFVNSKFIKDVQGYIQNGGTVEQIMNTRSDIQQMTRSLRGRGEFNEARRLSLVADQLKEVIDVQGFDGLDVARQFTRAKNDAFTRSFAGRILGTDREGARRIRPEDIIEVGLRLSRTSDETLNINELAGAAEFGDLARGAGDSRQELLQATAADARFREITDGTITRGEFIESVLGYDTPLGSSIDDSVKLALRAEMSKFLDPETLEFDSRGFSRFIRNNSSAIDRFPDVRKQVKDARMAERYFNHISARDKTVSNAVRARKVFSELLGTDDAVGVMAKALSGGMNPKEIRMLATSARRAEDAGIAGAVGGMKAALLKGAERTAMSNKNFSWQTYDNLLNGSIGGRKPMLDQMMELKVITKDEASRLRELIDVAKRAEFSLSNPDLALTLGFGTDSGTPMWADLAAAGIGSSVANSMGRQLGLIGAGGSGPSLVIASGGARIARSLVNKNLDDSVHAVLFEAMNNAKVFKEVMEASDPQNLRHSFRRMNSIAIASGLQPLDNFDDAMEEVEQDELRLMEGVGTGDEEQPSPEQAVPTDPDFFEQFRGVQ